MAYVPNAPGLSLDRSHARAVLQGIGEKMRASMAQDSSDMPQHLRSLIDRLPDLDRENAPSLVPGIDTH